MWWFTQTMGIMNLCMTLLFLDDGLTKLFPIHKLPLLFIDYVVPLGFYIGILGGSVFFNYLLTQPRRNHGAISTRNVLIKTDNIPDRPLFFLSGLADFWAFRNPLAITCNNITNSCGIFFTAEELSDKDISNSSLNSHDYFCLGLVLLTALCGKAAKQQLAHITALYNERSLSSVYASQFLSEALSGASRSSQWIEVIGQLITPYLQPDLMLIASTALAQFCNIEDRRVYGFNLVCHF